MPTFAFGPYELDFDTLALTSLQASGPTRADCAMPDGELTFVAAYGALRKEGLLNALNFMECKVATRSCEHVLSGPRWALSLLKTLIHLELKGVTPFGCTWFYYAREACLEDPQEAFRFFVVDHSGIVSENTRLSFVAYGDEPPAYLQPVSPPDKVWSGEDAEWRASIQDWYNQFYDTTHSGRVMVLRDDLPPLFGRRRAERP